MNTPIVPPTPAPVKRENRIKECLGCGNETPMTGLYCPTCRAAGVDCSPFAAQEVPDVPHKIVLPKPSKRETYPAACCRLAHQGYLNGATVTPTRTDYHWGPVWAVTSQAGTGGYSVTYHETADTWECGCEAHAGGKLCSHVALCRTWATECPCGAVALVYAARAGVDRPYEYCGAVRCLGACGLVADLTSEEAEAVQEAHLGVHTLPVLGLLLVVARRVERAAEGQAA